MKRGAGPVKMIHANKRASLMRQFVAPYWLPIPAGDGSRKPEDAPLWRRLLAWTAPALLLLCFGCRSEMYDQAKYKPYGASEFFEDGTSARPLVAGTIPRRDPRERGVTSTDVFETGMSGGKLVDELPFPVDRAVLERGQDRFRIFCTPCHGELGDGRGMIVRRGFNPPPSYHTQIVRDKPIGHYFDVMTRGYGTMYSYAARVPARDRWAIAAYIRALQLSQNAPTADLPAADRTRLPEGGP